MGLLRAPALRIASRACFDLAVCAWSVTGDPVPSTSCTWPGMARTNRLRPPGHLARLQVPPGSLHLRLDYQAAYSYKIKLHNASKYKLYAALNIIRIQLNK